MSYRFYKVKRDENTKEIVSELFELPNQAELPAWELEHLNWYDSKKDLLDAEKDVKIFKKKEVEPSGAGKEKLELTEEKLKIIIRLLKGEQINTRRGLSLTSFCNLFGISYNERGSQQKLKPKYELLLKQLKAKDEIKQVRKAWYYKNASVRGRRQK